MKWGEVSEGKITEGTDLQAISELPHSGPHMQACAAKELGPNIHAKKQGRNLTTSKANVA